MKKLFVTLCMVVLSVGACMAGGKKGTFGVGEKSFMLNGEPFVVKAAEIHYPRIPREYWDHRIKKTRCRMWRNHCGSN